MLNPRPLRQKSNIKRHGLHGKTRINLNLIVGALPRVRPKPREPNLLCKRAHTEVRPYKLIVPVVLQFRPLVARLCRFHSEAEKELGRQEGIVKHMSLILAKLQSPSNSPFPRGRNVQE